MEPPTETGTDSKKEANPRSTLAIPQSPGSMIAAIGGPELQTNRRPVLNRKASGLKFNQRTSQRRQDYFFSPFEINVHGRRTHVHTPGEIFPHSVSL